MTVFQVCVSIIILALGLILSIYNENFTIYLNEFFNKYKKTEDLLTLTELKQYNGETKPELYLAILGNVFDVSKGTKHYGPGGNYNIFVGRDCSRSFVTGEFKESEASDDVIGLTYKELLSVENWLKFYEREYTKVGNVIGRYYDKNGEETQYYKKVKVLLQEAAIEANKEKSSEIQFPPCNVEWDVNTGTRVWCTKRSGGVERDWIGFPRKLYEAGADTFRCACVKEGDLKVANIQEYEDCNSNYVSCNVKVTQG